MPKKFNIPKHIKDTMPEGVQIENNFTSMEEAKKDKNAIILDYENNKDDAPTGIGDLEKLTKRVIEFLQYINTDEMIKFENTKPDEFKMHVIDKFIDYFDDNSKVFTTLLDKQNRDANVSKLLQVIELLSEIQLGKKDLNHETEMFHETHNQQYVYPKFGGKVAFEETIKKRAKEGKK